MSDESSSAVPMSFEAALKRLEDIVRLLEGENVGLNESLERYEEGVKLLRQSYELLQRAERKIELLSGVDAEGNPVVESFDASATFDPTAAQDRSAGDQEKAAEGDETSKRRSRRRTAAPKKRPSGEEKPSDGGDDVDDRWLLS